MSNCNHSPTDSITVCKECGIPMRAVNALYYLDADSFQDAYDLLRKGAAPGVGKKTRQAIIDIGVRWSMDSSNSVKSPEAVLESVIDIIVSQDADYGLDDCIKMVGDQYVWDRESVRALLGSAMEGGE